MKFRPEYGRFFRDAGQAALARVISLNPVRIPCTLTSFEICHRIVYTARMLTRTLGSDEFNVSA